MFYIDSSSELIKIFRLSKEIRMELISQIKPYMKLLIVASVRVPQNPLIDNIRESEIKTWFAIICFMVVEESEVKGLEFEDANTNQHIQTHRNNETHPKTSI